MKVLKVVTHATASIREEWLLAVDDELAAEILLEPSRALDALAENMVEGMECTTLRVDDEVTGNEEDREVQEVTTVAG